MSITFCENYLKILKCFLSFANFLRMKKFFAYSFCFVLFSAFLCSCKQTKSFDSFNSMNTYMTVQVFSSNAKKGQQACDAVRDEIFRLEQILSTTIPESDVFKINNSGLAEVNVHIPVKELLDFSSFMYQKTDGLFNPAIYPLIREWGFTTENYKIVEPARINELLPFTNFSKLTVAQTESEEFPLKVHVSEGMQIDFGGIAKGYAGDRAVEVLSAHGIKSALLDLGGNIQAVGKKTDGSLWTVGIKCPWNPEKIACAVKIESKAVVTSGGYERFFIGEDGKRYIHIFDPNTGCPAESDLESVTIVCSKGIYADSLSTSLFVMGKERAIDFWKNAGDFDFVLITNERELVYSAGLSGTIKLIYPFEKVSVIE
jgi:thiamine biosynthesis lipoprotein